MKLICLPESQKMLKNCAELFTALVSSLFLVLPPCSAIAEESATLRDLVDDIDQAVWSINSQMSSYVGDYLNQINSSLNGLPSSLSEIESYLSTAVYNQGLANGHLNNISTKTGNIYTRLGTMNDRQSNIYTRLGNILTALQNQSSSPIFLTNNVSLTLQPTNVINLASFVTNNIALTLQPTNVINLAPIITGKDVLAGNPWWASNSLFVTSFDKITEVFPQDPDRNTWKLSFPEFVSTLAARLTSPYYNPTLNQINAYKDNWWGTSSVGSDNATRVRRNYTWFDWVADVMKSNRVAQSSLLAAVRDIDFSPMITNNVDFELFLTNLVSVQTSLTNLVEVQTSLTNFVDVQTYLTNLVNVQTYLTNLVSVLVTNQNSFSVEDILAANPWWATNSAFLFRPNDYLTSPTLAYPPAFDSYPYQLSFPELISQWASWQNSGYVVGYYGNTIEGSQRRWGASKYDDSIWRNEVYTWYDLVADFLKTNLFLSTAYSTNDFVETDELVNTGDDSLTNAPLPGYSVDTMSTPDISGSLQFGVEDFSINTTSADPEFTIIPAFTLGGISVNEYKASFELPSAVRSVIKVLMQWIWRVIFVLCVWRLIQVEYTFWVTLGNAEGSAQ